MTSGVVLKHDTVQNYSRHYYLQRTLNAVTTLSLLRSSQRDTLIMIESSKYFNSSTLKLNDICYNSYRNT